MKEFEKVFRDYEEELRNSGITDVRKAYLKYEITYFIQGVVDEDYEVYGKIKEEINHVSCDEFIDNVIDFELSQEYPYTMDFGGIEELLSDYFSDR